MDGSESAPNAGQLRAVLANVFENNGKRYRVKLTKDFITWEAEKQSKLDSQVELQDVVGVGPGELIKQGCLQAVTARWSKKVLYPEPNLRVNCFKLHFVDRTWKPKWRMRTMIFFNSDNNVIRLWITSIQDTIRGFHQRPKRLLVFINPFGGKRQSPHIYEHKIRPLFELAQIETQVIITQRANHAKDHLQEYPLHKVDGVICVGGDGMFNEVLNGLVIHAQREAGIDHNDKKAVFHQPNLRIGIIPGGSTDCVAFCTAGTNDPITAALQIILGDSLGLDVSSIHNDSEMVLCCTTMLGYGYFGDTLIESEKHRWMGPKRYDWSGMKQILQLKCYEGEVTFRCDPKPDNNPFDGTKCCTGCKVCERAPETIRAWNNSLPEKKGWEIVRGKFVAVNCVTTSCACARAKSGISPSAHLGDGCIDLILVSKCSRFNYLRYLLAISMQQTNPFNLDFVKVQRVREFQFRPLNTEEPSVEWKHESHQRSSDTLGSSSSTSVWNCDGEVISEPAISVKVHCQLVKLFARGIEERSPKPEINDLDDVSVRLCE